MRLSILFSCFLSTPLLCSELGAQCKLVGSDTLQYDSFGESVSVDGDVMAVGAWRNDGAAFEAGAVYLFHRVAGEWVEQHKLTASDAAVEGHFGYRVALCGDVLAVSTRGWFDVHSTAYVFHFDGTQWNEVQKFDPAGNDVGDFFGESLAATDDTIVIGSSRDDTLSYQSGRVYVYERSGASWLLSQEIGHNSHGGQYGTDVDISGDVIVVGSYDLRARLYRHDGSSWAFEQELFGSNDFASAVALDGDRLVVGAPKLLPATYVYRFDGLSWGLEQELVRTDAANSDRFGWSVDIDGERIAVGTLNADFLGLPGHGAVHTFRHDGSAWNHDGVVLPQPVELYTSFGRGVALDGETLAVATAKDYVLVDHPGAGPLRLESTLAAVSGGWNVGVSTSGGRPSSLCFLALVGLQGSPTFQGLLFGSFDGNGSHSVGGFVSDAFTGLSFDLQSFGRDGCGKVGGSNVESVLLQ